MKSVGTELKKLSAALGNRDDASRLARRIAEVHALWKEAIVLLYKDKAPYVLKHTNAVYIKKENGLKHLIVYMDDGGVRSDIHCQQHFILAWLEEVCGEKIDVFKTLPSRFDMRNRHPYEDSECETRAPSRKTATSEPLTQAERNSIDETVSVVADEAVRQSLKKAMNADLTWKKNEKQ